MWRVTAVDGKELWVNNGYWAICMQKKSLKQQLFQNFTSHVQKHQVVSSVGIFKLATSWPWRQSRITSATYEWLQVTTGDNDTKIWENIWKDSESLGNFLSDPFV